MFVNVDEEMLEDTFALHDYAFEPTARTLKAAGVKLRADVVEVKKAQIPSNIKAGGDGGDVDEKADDDVVIDDLDYEELRSDAYLHHRNRAQLFQKAQKAFESNVRPAAFYYSQLAHREGDKVRAANKRASEILFKSRHEAVEKSNKLDLHSLHVDEAVKLVKEILGSRLSELGPNPSARVAKSRTQITIITGRGNHSRGGNAKVRPSVVNYLKQHNFYFTEVNPGVIEVYLKQTIAGT